MGGNNTDTLISDEVLLAIRHDLAALKKGRTKKDDQARALAVMAILFYEIEAIFDSGGTQDDVLSVLVKHGVVMGRTRFGQNLYRLRQVFPKRERQIDVDGALVARIGQEMSDFVSDAKKEVCPPSGKRAPIKRQAIKKVSQETPLPLREKVLACASMIVEVAERGQPAVDVAAAALRAKLGPGWTFGVAVQFAVGRRFAEWAHADWQQDEDAKRVKLAQGVALHVAEAIKSPGTSAVEAAHAFYNRFSR